MASTLVLTLITFSLASIGFFSNAYAQFAVFENENYGFSIEYPKNWFVDDYIIENEPRPGYDEGSLNLVFITDDPNDWNYSISVIYIINDNIARHNQGQQYLDRLETRMKEICEIATFDIEELICTNHALKDSKLLEIDGKKAYQVTERWTQTLSDGSVYENWSVLTDVVVGNNVWSIDIITPESHYPNQVSLVDEIIRTFKTQDDTGFKLDIPVVQETLETISEQTEQLAEQIPIKEIEQQTGELIENISSDIGGGCLIATATYGTEFAPQVQQLRELRDSTLLQTHSGSSFMNGFNHIYYSFSPTIADWERQNPVFKEAVKLTITPLLTSLSILNYVEIDSEEEVLGYGIGVILLNIGMYFVAPAILIQKLRTRN